MQIFGDFWVQQTAMAFRSFTKMIEISYFGQ